LRLPRSHVVTSVASSAGEELLVPASGVGLEASVLQSLLVISISCLSSVASVGAGAVGSK
jgi:hypothetical protein